MRHYTHAALQHYIASVQMVQNLLHNIDSRKATGADGIPGLLLKKCAPILAPSLTAIFTASLAAGELPQAFKQADITPVYKSGDRETASNYRPISLLPIVSKLLEKIVLTQLKAILASNSLLPEIQFAYRANPSTEDALAFIVNRLLLERDCGKATGLVFVDLSKAFDKVKHQALIDLLLGIGICDTVLKWFANYLSDRQQRVRVGNRLSSQSTCSRGVPQGSVLGPLLFTLYVRDLPSYVGVKVLMFADDILLFFSGFSIPEIACRLTNAVTSLDSWLTTRGLQMNIGKTQAMFVLPRGLNIPPDTVVMCNSRPLQLVTSYKFLGVFLDNRLSWEAQILHITGKVSQKIGALLRAGQQLTLPAKRLYYIAIIAADIEYGSNAFYSSLSTSSKEKLIRLSKRSVRAIFRAPPWTPSLPLYQQLQICRLPQRMDYKLLVFTYRCTHSLTSTLLTNEFSVLGQSNARTRSITRGQSVISLSLPNVCHRSGTISPLFTCSLLWNSLPSSLRHPDVNFCRFRNALATYMGFPVTSHT